MSEQAILQFSALAHEVRYDTFRMLANAGEMGICAGDISKSLKVSPSTLSPHLAQLERSGLIAKKRFGTKLVYSIAPEVVANMVDHLVSDCCGGRPELCGGVVMSGEQSVCTPTKCA